MQRRAPILLGAAVVGAVFAAGLFIHGRGGGALLLLADGALITLSLATWTRVPPQGRPLRIFIIATVGTLAVAKLVAG